MTSGTRSHPRWRWRRATPVQHTHRAGWLGWAGGVLARLFGGRMPAVTDDDLRKHDYPTSTQRLGLRFTERMRDTFRFRWLRIHT